MCQNIKAKRAKTSREDIEHYFANLTENLAGVPDGNILNYDETNLVNDPKNRIFKTKVKRPERVINYTKSAFSVMFAVTDSGVTLPPYVVYKSEAIWNTWSKI